MKIPYTKPILLSENLSLTQNVSSSCAGIATMAQGLCAVLVTDFGFTIINQGVDQCEVTGPEFNDFVCYHNPTDDTNIFSS